ncbi:hypothetical protein H0I39_20455 [Ottowia beijingensis]|nr:hypothetical protein [Ottowia beijingensis]NZA03285.1 hypothetical protein [Ottowia beijingensis]NZA03449.1 hypothetical protein [Ottowia beijingensis]
MKKFILSAVAASAMAFGGFAHADLIDGVGKTLSQIFGVPYDPTPPDRPAFPVGTVYTDANGTRYQVDPAGRHIPLAQGPAPYADVVVPPTVAVAPVFDDDGDGVANQYDRYPYDGRYR